MISRLKNLQKHSSLLIILLFTLILPFANPRVYATDEVQYYVYLRSLRFDGDLNFENDYRELARRNPQSGIEGSLLQPNRIRPLTGLYGNIAPVGCAIMWAPFFVTADALVHVANLLGAKIPADGYSRPYILSVCYASALYGLLGLLLCQRLARRYASSQAATLATITIWLASPLVFYMFIQMPFAHATGFFLTALFITLWSGEPGNRGAGEQAADSVETQATSHKPQDKRAGEPGSRGTGEPGSRRTGEQGSRRHLTFNIQHSTFIKLGLVAGLMTMTREQLGLFLILPLLDGLRQYVASIRQGRWAIVRRLLGAHVLFGLVFVLSLTPQLAAYQVLNGTPRPAGEVSGRINWCSPHALDTLIDYNPAPSSWCHTIGDFTADFPPFSRGAFVWSPVLLLGLLGLGLLWRQDAFLALSLFLVFMAQTYINGAYGTTWHLRGAFGFRRLIECTPIFVIGLALIVDYLGFYKNISFLSFLPTSSAKKREKRNLKNPYFWQTWIILAIAIAFMLWNMGLILNATFFEGETQLRRIGLTWPDTWVWQAELPMKVLSRLNELLFERCRFLKNGQC